PKPYTFWRSTLSTTSDIVVWNGSATRATRAHAAPRSGSGSLTRAPSGTTPSSGTVTGTPPGTPSSTRSGRPSAPRSRHGSRRTTSMRTVPSVAPWRTSGGRHELLPLSPPRYRPAQGTAGSGQDHRDRGPEARQRPGQHLDRRQVRLRPAHGYPARTLAEGGRRPGCRDDRASPEGRRDQEGDHRRPQSPFLPSPRRRRAPLEAPRKGLCPGRGGGRRRS